MNRVLNIKSGFLAKTKCSVYQKRLYESKCVFGYKKRKDDQFSVSDSIIQQRIENSNLYRLIKAYRQYGHTIASINPVNFSNESNKKIPDILQLDRYGLEENEKISFEGLINSNTANGSIKDVVNFLTKVYTTNISAEFMHLEKEEEREWFAKEYEKSLLEPLENNIKIEICKAMLKSQTFDNFLGTKFPGLKRYGGEGAESMMAFFMHFFKLSANDNLKEIVIGIPHRGRLNILTGLLNYDPRQIFLRLQGNPDFLSEYNCAGDVLSHIISSTDLNYNNKNIHVTMLRNPSHLEAVNAVSMGKTRAKQMFHKDGDYGSSGQLSDKILNLIVHGDAALTGQGINQECLNLSKAPNFDVGGSVHLVVNNQLGFTTPSKIGRSMRYCTDVAKMISAPIIHVNGDYPEIVYKATKLVFDYQRKFRKDIFLDINCYRRWGHNELDDPTFTNPLQYKIINARRTVPDLYAEQLVNDAIITTEEKGLIVQSYMDELNHLLKDCNNSPNYYSVFEKNWQGYSQAKKEVSTWNTGVDVNLLSYIGSKSVAVPQNFKIHPTLEKTYVKNRLKKITDGSNIDWATAETLAFGSLLLEGYNVRISGQDVGRGTFSHRHVMLVDQETNDTYIPLNNLHQNQNNYLEVANSILSEEAVLGYEYGMSIESPHNLNIWEAQFGDFFNGAQIQIDTFIANGEAKWLQCSGLVMLLPHGYDGAGPEHSSSRIERFLQLTDSQENAVDGDDINLQICQPSTPSQYFHLLRRQMVRNYRKPLVIISPKTLLRLSECTSSYDEMGPGNYFLPVIGDKMSDPRNVNRILITSGRHYYTLLSKKLEKNYQNTAIIRLESFCPFPTSELLEEINKYPNAKVFVWCQEEHRNMGAWTFIKPRFENLIGRRIIYCGRKTSPVPAVGVAKIHKQEVEEIATMPFSI